MSRFGDLDAESGESGLLVHHQAEPRLELIGEEAVIPTILITIPAYLDILYIIAAARADEVGWLGTVEKRDEDTYCITGVYLFRQDVSGAHCEFDEADLGKFAEELLVKDPERGKKLLGSLLFWGHLHPGDMTEPSSQDEDQMELFNHNPYFIRGIFTRGGKVVFTFFDYQRRIKITDCPWRLMLDDAARRREIEIEMRAKVRNSHLSGIARRGRRGVVQMEEPWAREKGK